MANRTLLPACEMRASLSPTAHLLRGFARWACALGLLAASLAVPAAADYAAGLTAFNRKDYAKAFAEWIDPAKGGEAAAQHGIGMLYEMGAGVPYADPKAAADWYQKAVDQQYAPAINNLARLYADGRGVPADPAKAIELWSRAAAAGNNTARFNLGVQYANGNGVTADPKKAAEYLEQAAEGGLAEAQFALADFYRQGLGVPKDEAAARLWYQRAADAGVEQARAAIAELDRAAKEAAAPKPSEPAQEAAKTGEEPAAQIPPVPVEPAVPPQSAVDPTTPAPETAAPEPEAEQKPTEPAGEAKPAEQPAVEAAPPLPPAPEPTQQAEAAPADAAPAKAPAEEPAEPVEEPAEQPAEAEADAATGEAVEETQDQPAAEAVGEGSAAMMADDPSAALPLAESLTGDARVFRIWLYDSGQENDARSYWSKLTTQYPRLLKDLKLDLRRYFLGEAKGSIYRVFAGPFDNLAAAQGACKEIQERFSDQFCRPVIN